MDQHVNVQRVCLEIHSQAVLVSPINAQQVIRALIIKFVLADVANIVVKMWFVELAQHAHRHLENVFVNQTLLVIPITCVCHVSIEEIKKINQNCVEMYKNTKFLLI